MPMSDERSYPAGVPCWVDTDQPEVDPARRFYGDLFGWEFEDAVPAGAPGTYLIASLGGKDVAAIGPAESGAGAEWNTYIAVDDADAAAASVRAAGGKTILDPVDAGPGGRLAGCANPRGARFRLWQPRRRLGAQVVNAPGSWNFSDLHTSDPGAAVEFYAPLFGWEFNDVGFATMIRRPGYGNHLEATVDPGIRDRQAGVRRRPASKMRSPGWFRWRIGRRIDGTCPSPSRAETSRPLSPKSWAPESFRPRTPSGRRPRWYATRRARYSP